MLKWCHHVKLHLSIVRDFWKLIFKKKQWWARKRIHYSCERRIEKSVPCDDPLSSLSKPRDANRWSLGWNFLSHPHTYDGFLNYYVALNIKWCKLEDKSRITNEPVHEISNNVVCATSKGTDQPAHMRSLIRACARRLNILWVLSYWPKIFWRFLA